jgi:hypothetical protein
METVFQRVMFPRAAGGLVLVLAGAVGFALTAPDSWASLTALLAHLVGLALLYAATHIWMERFGGRLRLAAHASRGARQGCGIALLRIFLIVVLTAGTGIWLWFSAQDLNEIRLLISGGRVASAQIIGRDIVAANDPIGFVDYAYRTSPTSAPQDRFAVAHVAYPRYHIGQSFEVTYASAAPRVHRIGRVDWVYAVRRLLFWLLLLANGAAYLYLPLWLLEFRRRPPGSPA